MSTSLPGADLYTDFSGFSRMRAQAREGKGEGAREAAKQMEALLLGMMIKSMRAGAGAGLTESGASTHQSMYDSQMALNLAQSGTLGFAGLMLSELSPDAAETPRPDATTAPPATVAPATVAPATGFPAPERNPLLGRARAAPAAAMEAAPRQLPVSPVAASARGNHHPGVADVRQSAVAPVAPVAPVAAARGRGDHHPAVAQAQAQAQAQASRSATLPTHVQVEQRPAVVASSGRGDHHPATVVTPIASARDVQRMSSSAQGEQHATRAAAVTAQVHAPVARPAGWNDPDSFARDLWPAASRAARALGTEPEAVLAVAALETGWGKHMPRTAQGDPSFNMFGIKAHRRATNWNGAVTHSPTLEFEQGAFQRKVEPFRAYGSPDEAFQDFVSFIKGQPRYREALNQAADPVAFVHELHKAGYATDPRYGNKLESLLRSGVLGRARMAANDSATAVS